MTSSSHPFLILSVAVVVAALSCGSVAAAEGQVTFARFEVDGKAAYGVVEGGRVCEISGDVFGKWSLTKKAHALADVKLLVPTEPTKVFALAGNYKSHLGETKEHEHPEAFFKPPSCLIPNGAEIVIPAAAANVHYEAEMVIVVGKRAKNVAVEEAMEYVLGVTCGNDVSARDWQRDDIQWWRAKGSDTFGPCGPFIVSGIDYGNLHLQLRLNGEVKQDQNTKDLVHNIAQTVSWLSQHVTLEPGDLIYTGTCGTTTAMKPGDVVEVELEGVGVLRNPVVAAGAGK